MKSIRHSVVFLVGLMGLVQGFFGGSQLLAKASCTEKQSAGASANGMVVQGLAADSIAPKMQWFADAKLGILSIGGFTRWKGHRKVGVFIAEIPPIHIICRS